jgi:CheY-like chemotaxis protein
MMASTKLPELSVMSATRILIAEDDSFIVQDLRERLESMDYEISGTTPHGCEVFELARNLKPDLVLMDIHLPGETDGIEAAERLRGLDVPVVYVTGCCNDRTLARAQVTEPCGYVLKPYQTRELRTAIEIGLYKHRVERQREREVQGREAALPGVKTSPGLLPICCYCKKIKDDRGRWGDVEAYISKLTNISFTHGMCPCCFERVKKQLDAIAQNEGSVPRMIRQ